MSDAIQVLFLLDLAIENPLDVDAIKALLPSQREERIILRISQFGAKASARGVPQSWKDCADALHRMVTSAQERTSKHDGGVEYFVAGRAALPVFAHLGLELSKWANVTILNQRSDRSWDTLDLSRETKPADNTKFFTEMSGLHEGAKSEASGRVAVFISTTYPAQRELLRDYVSLEGDSLAGIVELKAGETLLDDSNAAMAAKELVDALVRVKATYPHLHGIALFVAGPASLAFLAGRAVNTNIIDDVLVPQHEAGTYKSALSLPWAGGASPALPQDEQAKSERLALLEAALSEIEQLRRDLRPEDLPPWISEEDRNSFVDILKSLRLLKDTKGDEFELLVAEGTLMLGNGLLEALRHLPPEVWRKVVKNLVLHELFHVRQNLHSTTYIGIGRAGFALEEVDYWADCFALRILSMLAFRQGGMSADEIGGVVESEIFGALRGAEAFDRAQQGESLNVLSERRLRRYLVWGLQRQRALTLRSIEQLDHLFAERLIVELAPLAGHLDARHDKIVENASAASEMFVVLRGALVRVARQGVFDPVSMIDAVRRFAHDSLVAPMKFVRDQNMNTLAAWPR